MIQGITAHPIAERPNCLLVGNGINRRFSDPSWEGLIKEAMRVSKPACTYEEISNMPSTMQIVAATADNVSSSMKDLSDQLMNIQMTEERKHFLQELIELPVDDILTANYSFELEISDGMQQKKSAYSSHLKSTFDTKAGDRRHRLYQYYETGNQKRIWHVHGDAAKPETMLMGHYYYAKQLRAIQDCVAKTVRRYKYCEKDGRQFIPYGQCLYRRAGHVFV